MIVRKVSDTGEIINDEEPLKESKVTNNVFFPEDEYKYCSNCGSPCTTNYCSKCGNKNKKDSV